MFYIYILKSEKNGRLYIGQTQDVTKRLLRHNDGLCRSTRLNRPYRLIYSENFDNRGDVMIREKYLKSLKNPQAILKLIE